MAKISKMAKLGHKNVTHQTFFTKSPKNISSGALKPLKMNSRRMKAPILMFLDFFSKYFGPTKKS